MFDFAQPLILCLLPLPLLVMWLLPAAKNIQHAALKVPFFNALSNLSATTAFAKRRPSIFFAAIPFLIWVLLVIAAAGPQWLGKPLALPRSGRDIMLAVDISGSMQIPDMAFHGQRTDRLSIVKYAADNFIKQRTGDRLGLILFGSKAYLQTPLTFDRKTVEQMLNDASIGLAGTQTAIGDAIGLAIKRLSNTPQKSRVLILLTDGANNSGVVSPLSAAKVAAKAGIKIYTIGIGASQMIVPGVFGPMAVKTNNELDEKSLKQIAKITGGLFFRAQNGKDLERVYQRLDQLEPVTTDKNVFRPIMPLYPWPLASALILSMFMCLRILKLRNLLRHITAKQAIDLNSDITKSRLRHNDEYPS